jgi:glutamyl-Q tRNA(Asp) synthetase
VTDLTPYRGRFAPSPTGPLHVGSLTAAMASFLQARAAAGAWLVRMEDLDPPREMPGAADDILRTLDAFGLHWDGEVMYQSRRHDAYREALAQLRARNAVYPCGCSRREIADSSVAGIDGPVYPGTCRDRLAPQRTARAVRVRTEHTHIGFDDRWQGYIDCELARDIGDFVVHRADGLFAYQLAVTVDDAAQGITEVVRGADLLWSTPRQIHLRRLLGFSTPTYAHVPAIVNARGEKLSKQTGAAAIDTRAALPSLQQSFAALGQSVDTGIDSVEDFWRYARAHWRPERVPRGETMSLTP